MKPLLDWWQSLQPREQQLVRWASIVVGISLVYFSVWQPVHDYRDSRQMEADAAQQQLQWLQQKLPLIQGNSSAAARGSQSLNEIVARTAQQYKINVSRMQPQKNLLKLSIDDVPFDELLRFLHQLQTEQGVQLVQLDIANTEVAGTVRVRQLELE